MSALLGILCIFSILLYLIPVSLKRSFGQPRQITLLLITVLLIGFIASMLYLSPIFVETPSIQEYQTEAPEDATIYTVGQVAPDEVTAYGEESSYSEVYDKLSSDNKPVAAPFDVLEDNENAYIQSDGRYYPVGTMQSPNYIGLFITFLGFLGGAFMSYKGLRNAYNESPN